MEVRRRWKGRDELSIFVASVRHLVVVFGKILGGTIRLVVVIGVGAVRVVDVAARQVAVLVEFSTRYVLDRKMLEVG